jgi:carbon-monoxide dehydrogenase medium subunit
MSSQPLLHRPTSEKELLEILAEYRDEAKVVAGGTAFTILWKAGLVRPEHMVSAAGLTDLAGVTAEDGTTAVGALTRLRDVERSPEVLAAQPVLAAALRLVANVRVRNVATMGGNVAEADPTSDPPAVLAALGARVEMASAGGLRQVPAAEFFVDYYETALRPDEVVRRVLLPDLSEEWTGSYVKFLSRSAEDRTCIGVAAFVRTAPDGGCGGVRVAAVGVAPVPLRLEHVEEQMVGERLDQRAIAQLAAEYVSAADPVSDVRGSADYRRKVLAPLIDQAVRRAVAGANDAVLA